MSKDYFSEKANTYENDIRRVSNVENIANAIISSLKLNQNMHLMDFGSGTGLLLERIAPYVRKITGVDISESMNRELLNKRNTLPCDLEVLEVNLVTHNLKDKYNGIISSMTMHHVLDIETMFVKFYESVKDGGFIAISDLDEEDGSFHTEDTGVYHFGFSRDTIASAAKSARFRNIQVIDASVVYKPHGQYPVFLLTAEK